MKKLLILFVLSVLLVPSSHAGNLEVRVYNHVSGPVRNRRVTITLLEAGPVTQGPWLIAGDAISQFTDTNGVTTFTNLLYGGYRADISGTPGRTFPFTMPDTNGTVILASIIGATNQQQLYYNQTQIDALLSGLGSNAVISADAALRGHDNIFSQSNRFSGPVVFEQTIQGVALVANNADDSDALAGQPIYSLLGRPGNPVASFDGGSLTNVTAENLDLTKGTASNDVASVVLDIAASPTNFLNAVGGTGGSINGGALTNVAQAGTNIWFIRPGKGDTGAIGLVSDAGTSLPYIQTNMSSGESVYIFPGTYDFSAFNGIAAGQLRMPNNAGWEQAPGSMIVMSNNTAFSVAQIRPRSGQIFRGLNLRVNDSQSSDVPVGIWNGESEGISAPGFTNVVFYDPNLLSQGTGFHIEPNGTVASGKGFDWKIFNAIVLGNASSYQIQSAKNYNGILVNPLFFATNWFSNAVVNTKPIRTIEVTSGATGSAGKTMVLGGLLSYSDADMTPSNRPAFGVWNNITTGTYSNGVSLFNTIFNPSITNPLSADIFATGSNQVILVNCYRADGTYVTITNTTAFGTNSPVISPTPGYLRTDGTGQWWFTNRIPAHFLPYSLTNAEAVAPTATLISTWSGSPTVSTRGSARAFIVTISATAVSPTTSAIVTNTFASPYAVPPIVIGPIQASGPLAIGNTVMPWVSSVTESNFVLTSRATAFPAQTNDLSFFVSP